MHSPLSTLLLQRWLQSLQVPVQPHLRVIEAASCHAQAERINESNPLLLVLNQPQDEVGIECFTFTCLKEADSSAPGEVSQQEDLFAFKLCLRKSRTNLASPSFKAGGVASMRSCLSVTSKG